MLNPKSLEDVSLNIPKNYKGQLNITTSYKTLLTQDCLRFIVLLHRKFNGQRLQLLANRSSIQKQINDGSYRFQFLKETENIRSNSTWLGPVIGPGLVQRHTEITGPPVRNMIINALNSDVDTYMTDFEDSLSPTWANLMDGQINLYDAIRDKINYCNEMGKTYQLNNEIGTSPTLIMRPRGWHMVEHHLLVDNEPISASIFDFGIYFYHNCRKLIEIGKGPYFYLPKMEHHLEAKLWNDIFNVSQDYLEIPRGTIRATVLIETLPAAFQMEEILFQLRQHSSGLNCGRWDYIFSTIKKLIELKEYSLPIRDEITMETSFMDAYVTLLIDTCHRRGVHAMGGMAAQIPIKDDPVKNQQVMAKVIKDKQRELNKGHDGSWIAHPALASICNKVFHSMGLRNQIYIDSLVSNDGLNDIEARLLPKPEVSCKPVSNDQIQATIKVILLYMGSWLKGNGCVPINNLMEDAATAEVSRCQLYQWLKNGIINRSSGTLITLKQLTHLIEIETDSLSKQYELNVKSNTSIFQVVGNLLLKDLSSTNVNDFLTVLLYEDLLKHEGSLIELSAQHFPSKL
ncbi:hypothetical protein C6P45_000784 [Maudiozyma exigua]|uniref:Malate synthase n=1 Tax=Maudiozyma exigua TaxID=34358 RepID=A0A9P7BDD1_MAUEX|nr:hypothetical protein C6P45_000784 [Kazachstania exigua]